MFNKETYLKSSASGQWKFEVVLGEPFTLQWTGRSTADIGVNDAVERLRKLKIHLHGPRRTAQTRRRPCNNNNNNNNHISNRLPVFRY